MHLFGVPSGSRGQRCVKPIFHQYPECKPLALGWFALLCSHCLLAFCVTDTITTQHKPQTSRFFLALPMEYSCVGQLTHWVHVGHVGFMLNICLFPFALGIQREHSFWCNMGFKVTDFLPGYLKKKINFL